MPSAAALSNYSRVNPGLFDEDDTEEVAESGESVSGSQITLIEGAGHSQRVLEDRWYQTKALQELDLRLLPGAPRKGGKGEILVSPTGCGKTSIATRFIRSFMDTDMSEVMPWMTQVRAAMKVGMRVLVVCDLDRLVEQMFEDLDAEGIQPIIEKADRKARPWFCSNNNRNTRCVLASAQTLKGARLQTWPRDSFDLIVIDECHGFFWLDLVTWFTAPYLGLTATPMRNDGQSMKEFFHYPFVRTLTLRQAIEGYNAVSDSYGDPFLARIRLRTIPAHHIDLSNIKLVGKDAKDLSPEESDRIIYEHTNWLASVIFREMIEPGRRPWVFCPKIRTSEALAEALRDMGVAAAAYHSQLDDTGQVLQAYRRFELTCLTNVNMLIKGINVPPVDGIVRIRPSVNIPQATQEIGRGTRNCPETGKVDCLVLEFDFQTGKRKLGTVLDAIMDGADDAEAEVSAADAAFRQRVRQKSQEVMESGETDDVLQASKIAEKRAREDLDREAAEKASRAAQAAENRAKYERVETNHVSQDYDPFCGLSKEAQQHDSAVVKQPATLDQMMRLEELTKGVVRASHINLWTAEMAAAKIREQENRKTWRGASDAQIKSLVENFGRPQRRAHSLKTWEAGQHITQGVREYAEALSAAGQGEYDDLAAMPPWKIAKLHKRHFPQQGGEN